jgi:hypothetical protein
MMSFRGIDSFMGKRFALPSEDRSGENHLGEILGFIGHVVRMAYNSAIEWADIKPESEPCLIR